jgi:alpha-beta hydrolase superfamily lysophospholipase
LILKSSLNIPDHTGKKLHVMQWIPKNQSPKAVVQIVHGIAEHMERYNHFANFLIRNGFAVIGHDHHGHGKTDPENTGFIAEPAGFELMTENINDVRKFAQRSFPGLPYILFAHSMGSFLVQRYMQLFDHNKTAIIYSGSSGKPPFMLNVGIVLSKTLMRLYGPESKSPLIDKLISGKYNKTFKPNRTRFDWLSRDPDMVDLYIDDPLSGFICTASFYYQLFNGVKTLHSHNPFADHDPGIPILLLAGSDDPVSGMGKGIKNLQNILIQSGIKNVDLQLYKGGRHEMLNEINRDKVYANLLNWMNEQIEQITPAA